MTGLGFNTDENRVGATMCMLQGSGKFETVPGNDPVIVVGCRDQRRWIVGAGSESM